MIRFPMVKVVFDDNDNNKAKVEITGTTFKEGMTTSEKLHTLYKTIGCSMVEVSYIKVGGKQYTVFSDEESKLGKWVPTLPLYNQDGRIYDVIPNSFVVIKEDENENFVPMDEKEFGDVTDYLRREVPKAIKVVRNVNNSRL